MRHLTLIRILCCSFSSLATAQTVHQTLSPPSPPPALLEQFGSDVCGVGDIDGDEVGDFAVYAPRAAINDPAVRVYSGADRSILMGIDLGAITGSKVRIASAGDVDQDHIPDLIVGVEEDSKAYVFSLRTGMSLRTHVGPPGTRFGASVTSAGIINGDTSADYAVGAPDGGVAGSGAVYVYSGENGDLLRLQLNPLLQGDFGLSVARVGDVNGDGYSDLIGGGSGMATVFTPANGKVVRTHQADGSFGFAVTALTDVDGDLRPDYAVGSPTANYTVPFGAPLPATGRVSVFSGATGATIWTRHGTPLSYLGWDIARSSGGPSRLAVTTSYDVRYYNASDGTLLKTWNPAAGTNTPPNQILAPRVAVIGDIDQDVYSEVLIGAGLATIGETLDGVTRIYSGENFAFVDQVTARTGQASGGAVAILDDVDGDGVPDTAIGAPHDDSFSHDGGSVRVRSGNTGVELWSYHGHAGSQAGAALATLSDVDGDGISDLAVGEPRRQHFPIFGTAKRAGKVVVLSGASGTVLYTAVGAAAGDLFGTAITQIGDVNGDQRRDFAVGSPGHYDPTWKSRSGQVSIHSGSDGSTVSIIAGDKHSRTGTALAPMGLVNADGIADLAIGAPGKGNHQLGQVTVVALPSGLTIWKREAPLTQQGTALGAFADLTGDGIAELIVCDPYATVLGSQTGRVQVVSGVDGSVWITLNGESDGGRFGASAAPAGDINLDGIEDIAIGAPGEHGTPPTNFGAGRVYVYSGLLPQFPIRTWKGTGSNAGLGASLDSLADYDGDGIADLVSGSPDHDAGLGRTLILGTGVQSTLTYGTGTLGCYGKNPITLSAEPKLGKNLNVLSSNGLAGAPVYMALSLGGDVAGTDYGFGCLIHWDLTKQVALVSGQTDSQGNASFDLPIPALDSLIGLDIHCQVLFQFAGAGCSGLPQGISSSPGLTMTIQP